MKTELRWLKSRCQSHMGDINTVLQYRTFDPELYLRCSERFTEAECWSEWMDVPYVWKDGHE